MISMLSRAGRVFSEGDITGVYCKSLADMRKEYMFTDCIAFERKECRIFFSLIIVLEI